MRKVVPNLLKLISSDMSRRYNQTMLVYFPTCCISKSNNPLCNSYTLTFYCISVYAWTKLRIIWYG